MLPNFIVIGAAKCGTTSICELLGEHPDVFMSSPKEPRYFSHKNEGHRTRQWYEALFDGVTGQIAIGEGSTTYTHPDLIRASAKRIRKAIPHCRLIYMARHPLRRLESDWKMRRHEGWTPASISVAVKEQTCLIAHGLYWKNLSVYRENFPDEQILILFLDDFVKDPALELKRCFAHIGVDTAVFNDRPARPRNSTSELRKDRLVAATLRQIPGFQRAKSLFPSWLIKKTKGLLTQQENFALAWDSATKQQVVNEIRPDSELLFKHCGKPPDFWDFTED